MRRSTAALVISVLLHIIILLLFFLLSIYSPEIKKSSPKKEQRMKVSLKERPKVTKESFEKNKVKPTEIAPPMPKGKQLEKLVKEHVTLPPRPKPVERPKPITKQPVKRKEPPRPVVKKPVRPKEQPKPKPPKKSTRALPPKKKTVATTEVNQTKVPKKKESNKLYAMLSKAQRPEKTSANQKVTKTRSSRVSENIKEAYGDAFGKLSEGEQKYILDNQEIMRRITQEVLTRVGRVNLPNNLRVNASNIIEFDLYPNGDISEIRFIDKSGFYILDDTTKETIEYAYSRYPRPDQKTLIRYKVGYYLRGY